MGYARSLKFEETPDYEWLKKLFRGLFWKNEKLWDFTFDWQLIPVLHSQKGNEEKGFKRIEKEQRGRKQKSGGFIRDESLLNGKRNVVHLAD